ncbi:MAG: energy-coupling factor transporter ATPase [Limnochordia bacterium]|nr:energy-coupling factor transporter ATPase [Limnochordia bacterium]MDD2630014.1 energy-coupling factor transporter ATPase [Limnochordia bacterium]MDD4517480.1 energy-coupling factor transporter ATPase [Limnochordia bacterium]
MTVSHVTYAYEEHADVSVGFTPVLDDLSLNIDVGEYVAIIGSNGSGKSTLARHLNALLIPAEGEVLINGRSTKDPEAIREIRSTVGMVFQNPENQLIASTVEEDIAFGPENLGVPPEEIGRRIEESLQAVGMLDYRHRLLHELSGGQKQRIAIAGILAMRPRCLVLDEPTAMLDPGGRSDVLRIIEELNQQGITIILITHFMEEAARAERIIVLERGRIRKDDCPRKILYDTELLDSCGLASPPIVKLSHLLRHKGVSVGDVIDVEEMVNALCQYR